MIFSVSLRAFLRSRLRAAMRGYLVLQRSGRASAIAEIKIKLADQNLGISRDRFSSFLMCKGINEDSYEICVRQYLLLRAGGLGLNKALYRASSQHNKKLIAVAPKQWRQIFENGRYRVANKRSELLWRSYLLCLIGYSCILMSKIIYKSIRLNFTSGQDTRPYIYFHNLGPGNIPSIDSHVSRYDVISWYAQNLSNRHSVACIKHDATNSTNRIHKGFAVETCTSGPIPNITGWANLAHFLLWSIASVLISIFDLIRGRWWHPLILNQAVLAKQMSLALPESVAREYLFHNENLLYRPLWTYEAEKRGAEITMYFYSTNIEGFKTNGSDMEPFYAQRCLNWKRYLVWNEFQANFVRQLTGLDGEVEAVGPIWFSDIDETLNTMDDRVIAVFGVTPHRTSQRFFHGISFDYYSPKNCIKFLDDAFEAAKQQNYKCVVKAKRDAGSFLDKSYGYFIKNRLQDSEIIEINPAKAALAVIEKSTMVISMPFTSTALIAKDLGIPTCYYDPSGILYLNDKAAHDIQIIQTPEQLKEWIFEHSEAQC